MVDLPTAEAAALMGVTERALRNYKARNQLSPTGHTRQRKERDQPMYHLRDIVAGRFAKACLELGFGFESKGKKKQGRDRTLDWVVKIIQHGTREDMETVVLVTVTSSPGMMRHHILNTRNAEVRKQLRKWEKAKKGEEGFIISRTDLAEVCEGILRGVWEEYTEQRLRQGTPKEAV